MELVDEPFAGFGEGAVAVVHDEFEEVALGAADEAFENALLLAEVQGGVLVVVIGAEGSAAFIAQTFQMEAELVGNF